MLLARCRKQWLCCMLHNFVTKLMSQESHAMMSRQNGKHENILDECIVHMYIEAKIELIQEWAPKVVQEKES